MHVSTLSMGISLERMSVLGPRGLRPLGPKTDILSRDIPHAQSGDIYITTEKYTKYSSECKNCSWTVVC